MGIRESIRQRVRRFLSTLLRPWVLSNLHSHINFHLSGANLELKQIVLDVRKLNDAAMSSSPLLLLQAELDSLDLHLSPLHTRVATVVVRGLHLVLQPRQSEDLWWEASRQKSKQQHREFVLAGLDPQGAAAHYAAKQLVEADSTSTFFATLLASFALSSFRLELHQCSAEVVTHARDGLFHSCSISLESLIFEEGFTNRTRVRGGIIGAAVAAIVRAWSTTDEPYKKCCQIKGMSLRVDLRKLPLGHLDTSKTFSAPHVSQAQADSSGSDVATFGTILSFKEIEAGDASKYMLQLENLLIVFDFTKVFLKRMKVDIPCASLGLDAKELVSIVALLSQLYGPDSLSSGHGSFDSTQLPSSSKVGFSTLTSPKRTAVELWQLGFQKAVAKSSKSQVRTTLLGAILRRRYSSMYKAWLLKIGWGENREVLQAEKRKDRSYVFLQNLNKLQNDIKELENGLSVEAVALARRAARHGAATVLSEKRQCAMENLKSEQDSLWSQAAFYLKHIFYVCTGAIKAVLRHFKIFVFFQALWSWMYKLKDTVVVGADHVETIGCAAFAREKEISSALPSTYVFNRLFPEAVKESVSRMWVVAYEVHIGRSCLTFVSAAGDEVLEEGGARTIPGDPAAPSETMVPALKIVLEQFSVAYGSNLHADGASIACGRLGGELLSVFPEDLHDGHSEAWQDIDAEYGGHQQAKTADSIEFLSSNPITAGDKPNNDECGSLLNNVIFGSIRGKHKIWRDKEVGEWAKRDWGSLLQDAIFSGCKSTSSESHSRLCVPLPAKRPFLVAEFEMFKSEKWTGGAPAGLICCMMDMGRLECLLNSSFFTRINPLIVQFLQAVSFSKSWAPKREVEELRRSESEVKFTVHEACDVLITRCLMMFRKQMVAYIPRTSFQCSIVLECPQLRLSASTVDSGSGETGTSDDTKEASILLDFGHLELVTAPVPLREGSESWAQQCGDSFTSGSCRMQTAENNPWLEMPPLPGLQNLVRGEYSQCETFAHNILVCLQQCVAVLDNKEWGQAADIAGPLAVVLKLSLRRDEFGSLFATVTSAAGAVHGEMLGLTFKAYICELLVISHILRSFHEALKTLSGTCIGYFGSRGEGMPDELALLVSDSGVTHAQHQSGGQTEECNQEYNKSQSSSFAVSVHLHVQTLEFLFGIERWEEGCEKSKNRKALRRWKRGPFMTVELEDTLNAWINYMERHKLGVYGYFWGEGLQSSFIVGDGHQASISASFNQLRFLTMDSPRAREVTDLQSEKLKFSSIEVQSRLDSCGTVVNEVKLDKCTLSLVGPAVLRGYNCVHDAGNADDSNQKPINNSASDMKAINHGTGSDFDDMNVVICVEIGQVCVVPERSKFFTKKVNQLTSGSSTLCLEVIFSTDLRKICCELKGGLLFLETATLVSLLRFLSSYQELLSKVLKYSSSFDGADNLTAMSTIKHKGLTTAVAQRSSTMLSTPSRKWGVRKPRRVSSAPPLAQICMGIKANGSANWEGSFFFQMRGFSLILSRSEASGVSEGLLLELDASFSFELSSSIRSVMVDLSRFMISGFPASWLGNLGGVRKVVQAPRFGTAHSTGSGSSGSISTSEGLSGESNLQGTLVGFSMETGAPDNIDYEEAGSASNEAARLDASTYILEQLRVYCVLDSAAVQASMYENKWSLAWQGACSITGLDIALTTSEIKLMQSLMSPFSELPGKLKSEELHFSSASLPEISGGETSYPIHDLQDGTIVAIKDEEEHLYLAVEEIPSKHGQYRLVSVMHYSLAGRRALFKVHYKDVTQKSQWFCLMSLYAKSADGEPLRVHYRPGSGLAEISSTNDGSWEFWQCVPYRTAQDQESSDFNQYNYNFRKMVHLINQKSKCYLAIVDNIPMIVGKPGNPFKVKEVSPVEEKDVSNLNDTEVLTTARSQRETDLEEAAVGVTSIPKLTFEVDSINVTVLHEAGGGLHLLPLLRFRMENVHALAQLGAHKTRLISGCNLFLEYFEAQTNWWAGITNPVEVTAFYRKRTSRSGSAARGSQKIPTAMLFRFRKVDITVSEPSLDACLFLIGVLDLAGPYTIRHSPLAANQCTVHNHLGVDLLCRFKQSEARVRAWDSGNFFIRHTLSRRDISSAIITSAVDLYLDKSGAASSSPVHVSLVEPGVMALRTRLNVGEGRTAPGPIIVLDVSRHREDGVTLTVSSMVRIRNDSSCTLELRCRRPNQMEGGAVVVLEDGDVIDDATGSFDALTMEGEYRKVLSSFTVGNFLLSIRPAYVPSGAFADQGCQSTTALHWSDDVKGAKAERVSGLFENLHYNLRKSLKGLASESCFESSFGTVFCPQVATLDGSDTLPEGTGLHFLVRTTLRQIPLTQPPVDIKQLQSKKAVWQEQQELLLLPTIRLYNLLTDDIRVELYTSSKGESKTEDAKSHVAAEESIVSGGRTCLYIALDNLCLLVKNSSLGLTSKPVAVNLETKSSKELLQMYNGGDLRELEMEIDFADGIHIATLKVFRGPDGVIEVLVFTKYTIQNDSDVPLLHCAAKSNSSKWGLRKSKDPSMEWPSHGVTSQLGPHSRASWFKRSTKLLIRRQEPDADMTVVDVESLSGAMEINLGVQKSEAAKEQVQLGVNMKLPSDSEVNPTNVVQLVPRYVIVNESPKEFWVCQDGFQEDIGGVLLLDPGDHKAIHAQVLQGKRERSHTCEGRDLGTNSLLSIRLRPKEIGCDWSGPLCLASLGTFCVRIRRLSDGFRCGERGSSSMQKEMGFWFAFADCQEESASLVMRIRFQSSSATPYRIENALHSKTILYKQKGLNKSDILGPGASAPYAWDDLSLPHKLVITIAGTQLSRDINLDKVRSWKPFQGSHSWQKKRFTLHLPFQDELDDGYDDDEYDVSTALGGRDVGFEVYAEGTTRIVRISEQIDTSEAQWSLRKSVPRLELELKVPILGLSIVEPEKQAPNSNRVAGQGVTYVPIICPRMTGLLLEMGVTYHSTVCQVKVQRLDIDVKWRGAPFAALLRVSGRDRFKNDTVLHFAAIVSNKSSSPLHIRYASFLLQAMDLNLDEDTLMKLASFYRSSLADASTPSRQIYFDRLEIHPIKIVASFLPGNTRTDYTSAQETLRGLLHSVIKIPSVRGKTVELNGVLLSHALLTYKQLALKCAQHYSWYAMRAIYMARGSELLPPAFASLFDDTAAASLDVFFDPSSGSIDFQGLTLGMFSLLSHGLLKQGQGGTRRYLGDLEKTMKSAGSNLLFAVVTEISDNVLKGAESNGVDGMVTGFRRGILNVAMEPSLLRSAVVKGGSTRQIKLDRSVGMDEVYVEGYIQGMLDARFKQDYMRVKVVDDQVILKNLPPNTELIEDIIGTVKSFLVGEGLLTEGSQVSGFQSMRRLQGENERRLGPALYALSEQLLVIIAVRALRNQARKAMHMQNGEGERENPGTGSSISHVSEGDAVNGSGSTSDVERPTDNVIQGQVRFNNISKGLSKFLLSTAIAYIDGRLCRHIPNPFLRRIVSGFLLSFIE